MKTPVKTLLKGALAGVAALAATAGPSAAQNLMISASLPQVHMWVGQVLDPFATKMEERTDLTFTRFYAGELVGVGRGLDALQGGTVDIISPLLAPYIPGAFPLTDVSQLPVYGTDSAQITRAFQKLMDSDVELKDGKTFYQYEIEPKNIVAWALGASGPYVINTTSKEITSPADFQGLPLRAGAALQTMTLENLGVNPVTMPAAQAYEALSRKTIEGILLSVADWKSYSMTELLKYSIEGVALGHWESYHAISKSSWDSLTEEQQRIFDETIRETALENAEFIQKQYVEVRETAEAAGTKFVQAEDLPQDLRDHIATAAVATWKQWIETLEADGHPARKTAQLWSELVLAEGGELPPGVAEYLAD
ncbi:TRAP transporter substrate-binding protein DctP [uncultured Albimonas sp.]|uniref:TRAP transporter substrate-binding protein DctP n=1 Tax=uncultured Albimonas sp. TaxID=1331701 RepID=UPI0030ECE09A|tara:strand:+ start:4454 stop:5551 length:1098 start_codon:yes stop_codon:yes gene_type:complete